MDMNLQYFAEEAASSSETGAPEGTEAVESHNRKNKLLKMSGRSPKAKLTK